MCKEMWKMWIHFIRILFRSKCERLYFPSSQLLNLWRKFLAEIQEVHSSGHNYFTIYLTAIELPVRSYCVLCAQNNYSSGNRIIPNSLRKFSSVQARAITFQLATFMAHINYARTLARSIKETELHFAVDLLLFNLPEKH